MKRGGQGGGGEDGFEGVKVICYDSADWVRKNFKARVEKHNEVCMWVGAFSSREQVFAMLCACSSAAFS